MGGDVATRTLRGAEARRPRGLHRLRRQAPKPERSDVTALRPAVPRLRKYMDRVAELHRAGAIKVPDVSLFPLAEAAKALGVSEGRHFKGKLILKMR